MCSMMLMRAVPAFVVLLSAACNLSTAAELPTRFQFSSLKAYEKPKGCSGIQAILEKRGLAQLWDGRSTSGAPLWVATAQSN
jgi:hypothetical protein